MSFDEDLLATLEGDLLATLEDVEAQELKDLLDQGYDVYEALELMGLI